MTRAWVTVVPKAHHGRKRIVTRTAKNGTRSAPLSRGAQKVKNRVTQRLRNKSGLLYPKGRLTTRIRPDGPMSDSYFKWRVSKRGFRLGKLDKLMAPQFWVGNQTYRLTAGIGVQAVTGYNGGATTIPAIYSTGDIAAQFNQAKLITGGGSDVQNPNTQKVYFKQCRLELLLTNQTNDVVHVQIFECMARRDIAAASSSPNPGIAWAVGNVDTNTTNLYQTVGSNPFQSPTFTELYKVQKVFDINLHSGAHHRHTQLMAPKAVYSYELLENVGTALSAIAGLTGFIMVVVHGYAINDNMTLSQISTANVAVDLIWRKQYEYYVLERSTTAISSTNNLPTSFTNAGELINDLTGAVAAVTIA